MSKLAFKQAKAVYVHRFTMEHIPAWALRPIGGKYHAPQYRTDREWYDNTTFPGQRGYIGGTDHCMSSNATWPLGQWLNAPYTKEQQS